MSEQLTLPNTPFEHPAVDYAILRQEGIHHLERMAGRLWTDFNSHDPGITILEQFCYALTDLANRIDYPMPDLLSSAGESAYSSLPSAAEVLSQNPVTLADLRKVIIDVPGVRNAWIDKIEPVGNTATGIFPLYYDTLEKALRLQSNLYTGEPITLKGLYRVQFAAADGDQPEIQRNVLNRLHQLRGLCEDFGSIEPLKTEVIGLTTTIEIGDVADIDRTLRDIYRRLNDYISPQIQTYTLSEQREAGKRVDEIFEGPRLEQGFVDIVELQQAQRKSVLRTSDMIRVIMNVPGVKVVRDIRITNNGSDWQDWSLALDPEKVPQLAPVPQSELRTEITLQQNGVPVRRLDQNNSGTALIEPATTSVSRPSSKMQNFPQLSGRNRNVGNYYSLQHHFPITYGIGTTGLPESASAQRQAQAKQLKAYLMFYDQVLANLFAQLAHAPKLFSFSGHSQHTYFTQAFWQQVDGVDTPNAALGLDEIISATVDGENLQNWLQRITEGWPNENSRQSNVPSTNQYARAHRFLNHLLARFAEQVTDYSLVLRDGTSLSGQKAEQKSIEDKERFLRDYVKIGYTRGTAYNCLMPSNSESGLERRLRGKLGINEESETFYLIEHILLRPVEEDRAQQTIMAGPRHLDPYSLQLSVVFPKSTARFRDSSYRVFIEQTIREETPAHLTVTTLWLDDRAMAEFKLSYEDWRNKQRSYRSEKRNGDPINEIQLQFRAARDRLIDLLGIGQTYPLSDLGVRKPPPETIGTETEITIEHSQEHVLYQLYQDEAPVMRPDGDGEDVPIEKWGDGQELQLEIEPVAESVTYTIRTLKQPWYLFPIDDSMLERDGDGLVISMELWKQLLAERGLTVDEAVEPKPGDFQQFPTQTEHQILQSFKAWILQAGNSSKRMYHIVKDPGGFDVYLFSNTASSLHETATVVAGINTAIKAWIVDAAHLDPTTGEPTDDLPRIVDYGTAVSIQLETRQHGITYQLVSLQNETEKPLSDEPIDDNEFAPVEFHIDTDIRIRARRIENDVILDTELLDVVLPLKVRANPGIEIAVTSPVIDFGDTATISIQKPQPDTTYQIYTQSIPDSLFKRPIDGEAIELEDFISVMVQDEVGEGSDHVLVQKPARHDFDEEPDGPDRYELLDREPEEVSGNLHFRVESLTEDTLIIVKATREHTVSSPEGNRLVESAVQLENSVVILVHPNPDQALTIEPFMISDAGTGGWEVRDGQPGVFYYFRMAPNGDDIRDAENNPISVYFHKPADNPSGLNKGIGQPVSDPDLADGLAIEVDFVIGRSLPSDAAADALTKFPPLPPLLEDGQLPTDLDLSIRAAKAQTRVATMLNRTIRLESS